jgi:hypothetical protein
VRKTTSSAYVVIIGLTLICSTLIMGPALANPSLAASSGGMIDLFTNRGGLGLDKPGGIFQPQELVILCAVVTLNGDSIINGLVAFEIHDPINPYGNITILHVSFTNKSGVAEASFRIPLPLGNQGAIVYGKWNAIATTKLGDETLNDTLTFLVTIPGDVDHNGKVDLNDLALLAEAYGSRPNDPNWNPCADIDNDQYVGLLDLTILASHYGQTFPYS